MVVLLAEKLVYFLKLEHSSTSLLDFRSKISYFLTQIENGSELMPMACFEMMHVANTAFANLMVEMDYPMSRWGAALTHHYLTYTLSLLQMLNSITSSLSHLNMLKICMLHDLTFVHNSPNSGARYLMKMGRSSVGRELTVGMYPGIEMRTGSKHKEGVILEAFMELKKIGFFALGLVLSGLCSDAKPYIKEVVESRFCREMREMVKK